MRCKICDFSPTNPQSNYRDSLNFNGQNEISVVRYNYETQTYSCPLCQEDPDKFHDYEDVVEFDEMDDAYILDEEFDHEGR